MLRFVILVVLFVCSVQAQEHSTAEKMAALSDLGWLDTGEEAIKRYEYILPRIVDACSDIPNDSDAGDMLYVGHKFVKEAGVAGKENLLKYTESAYQIVRRLRDSYQKSDIPMKCGELFSMYTIARREGQSSEKAIETVCKGVAALMNLMKN